MRRVDLKGAALGWCRRCPGCVGCRLGPKLMNRFSSRIERHETYVNMFFVGERQAVLV